MRLQRLNELVDRDLVRSRGTGVARSAQAAASSVLHLLYGFAVALRARCERNLPLWRARSRLRLAQARHRLALWGAKTRLARAEAAHRWRVRRAGRELRRTEGGAARALADAGEEALSAATPQQLASFGPVALYEDRVRTEEWEAPLATGVRAVVVPGGVARPLRDGDRTTRRSCLVVEAGSHHTELPCRADDAEMLEFVRLLNVAALNAGQFGERRRAAALEARRATEETRSEWTQRVDEARERLESAQDDRAAIEATQRLLDETAHDVAEIDARRAALEDLEQTAGRPPSPGAHGQ